MRRVLDLSRCEALVGGARGGSSAPYPQGRACVGGVVGGRGWNELSLRKTVPLSLMVHKHGRSNGFLFSFVLGYVSPVFVERGPKSRGLVGSLGAANVAMTFDHGRVEVLGLGDPRE